MLQSQETMQKTALDRQFAVVLIDSFALWYRVVPEVKFPLIGLSQSVHVAAKALRQHLMKVASAETHLEPR